MESHVLLIYVLLCYVMLCYVMLCYAMLCYAMLCYVMFAWGLSALLTPNALILHTACGLAISRNYKASEPSGDGALAHCHNASEVTDIMTVCTI